MLTDLRIKNLALADNAQVEFTPGLNAITGETGAGKSILMGALSMLLGERADKSLIRAGETSCSAEAIFQLAEPGPVNQILDEAGLEPCEEGVLVLRRAIRHTGSSQNIVNDTPVTLQILRRIGDVLVDMHGPHDHQSLLDPDAQLELLDAFGHLDKLRSAYTSIFEDMKELEEKRNRLAGNTGDAESELDLLRFRLDEIEKAELREDEEEELLSEQRLLGNAQRIQELAGGVLHALTESEGSAFDTIAGVRRAAGELEGLVPGAEEWGRQLDELASRVQELEREIHGAVDDVESNPVRLQWIDDRLGIYQKLKRKYGPSVQDILAAAEEARVRLDELENREEQIALLDEEIGRIRSDLNERAEDLTASRTEASQRLADGVAKELQGLGLGRSGLRVCLHKDAPRSTGCDRVEIEFAPNAGEPAQPLRNIASSGEISRVMLALKCVLAKHDRIPVLVFDEIDTNIGGEMAGAVGRKIAGLAENRQVICITHFPQVAVYAEAHFAVEKFTREGRTYSRVSPVRDDQRVEEIARMLGGRDLTSVTMEHAREMLKHKG